MPTLKFAAVIMQPNNFKLQTISSFITWRTIKMKCNLEKNLPLKFLNVLLKVLRLCILKCYSHFLECCDWKIRKTLSL